MVSVHGQATVNQLAFKRVKAKVVSGKPLLTQRVKASVKLVAPGIVPVAATIASRCNFVKMSNGGGKGGGFHWR
ncbi:hypothetical protein [Ralstonia phage RP31]|uniref:Uncharacterized protein n=1 Tax=Ralstonia phage RP31 TaxID=1923890 RepID=A0A1L7N1P8_9CAUD|nr:hypothetical protein [Ralstonia phage RP31]